MSIRTTNFDALATSAPLNRDAAVARDYRGSGYVPKLDLPAGYVRSDTPLPLRFPNAAALGSGTFDDLTGQTFGRLKAQGLYAVNTGDKAAWVVRCACGFYEVRRGAVLKAARFSTEKAEALMCAGCNHTENLKRGAQLIAKGKAKPTEWVLADRQRQGRFENVRNALVKAALAFDADGSGRDDLAEQCAAYRALVAETQSERSAA